MEKVIPIFLILLSIGCFITPSSHEEKAKKKIIEEFAYVPEHEYTLNDICSELPTEISRKIAQCISKETMKALRFYDAVCMGIELENKKVKSGYFEFMYLKKNQEIIGTIKDEQLEAKLLNDMLGLELCIGEDNICRDGDFQFSVMTKDLKQWHPK